MTYSGPRGRRYSSAGRTNGAGRVASAAYNDLYGATLESRERASPTGARSDGPAARENAGGNAVTTAQAAFDEVGQRIPGEDGNALVGSDVLARVNSRERILVASIGESRGRV